ncbi:uncharacterized protein LOC126883760 [Diabrotica virgifera virgifera]|uniref:PiggyBac transposable element-derived protein domain-containing protein n=1 Tax=Diabrotica virgifera virgifera TaxID=50390 RepID=A0ABM5K5B0_DIAVI|nr:uncharacterized protein LOC126883760 [Diabrotica virgifera virgifera]
MWKKNKPLSEAELYALLLSDSEEDDVAELDESNSEASDNDGCEPEAHEGNLSITEHENEDVLASTSENIDSERSNVSDVLCERRTWRYLGPKKGKTLACNLLQKNSGLTEKSQNIETCMDAFNLFFSDSMMSMILEYTNKRAIEFTAAYNIKKETKMKDWIEVDLVEMRAFFGILILCGRFRESHEKVHNLWSNTNQSLSRPIYKASLSRDRFISILKHIALKL